MVGCDKGEGESKSVPQASIHEGDSISIRSIAASSVWSAAIHRRKVHQGNRTRGKRGLWSKIVNVFRLATLKSSVVTVLINLCA